MKRWKIVSIVIGILVLAVLITLIIKESNNGIELKEKPKVALVKLEGLIMIDSTTKSLFSSSKSSDDILEDLKAIEKDKTIKGLIIEINSPGGMVVASQEIADQVKKLNIPKIALVREVGASGAYWIASAADIIVASPMSITGSIGVISSYLEFADLFNKYGVNYQRLVAGDRKDLANPYRKLENDERNILQSKLDKIHSVFVSEVARNRKMNEADVWKSATGEFFLGVEAKERGLVDVLGNFDTAKGLMKEKLGVTDIQIVNYEHQESLFSLLGMVSTEASYNIGRGIGDSLVESNSNGLIKV